ncbi:MAG TPA: YihA family ribosome biogenesis GTP-binding protein, partial [Candidatus Pelethenecus sp.]|nr:YihA family ribosome biogenesis GTP-binding protein [Candidatus Pelethenecus sp.]
EDDVLMYQFLKYYDKNVCVIATKADKIKKSERAKNKNLITNTLKLDAEDTLILTSSETKEGLEQVLQKMECYLT